MTGKGAIADSHPLSAGVLGSSTGGKLGRGKIANQLLGEADLVFILGSRTGQICYSDWSLPKPGVTVMHLDIDPEEIGRNFATDLPMVGDVRDSLRDLLGYAKEHGLKTESRDNGGRLAAMHADWRLELEPAARAGQTPIRPERVFDAIDRVLDDKSLLVTDASYVTGWAMSQLSVPASGRFILSPRGTGGRFPAALGPLACRRVSAQSWAIRPAR